MRVKAKQGETFDGGSHGSLFLTSGLVAAPAQGWHLWGTQLRGKLEAVVIGVWGTKEAASGWVLGGAVREMPAV